MLNGKIIKICKQKLTNKLRYWYYRSFKFKSIKFKIFFDSTIETGDIMSDGRDEFLSIGKNYFVHTNNL